ncbi:MAG TPA: hypothetical protein VFW78_06410 [Bacteroidia bacterium]|nr:hypothetical protein [Bacteroidia bacterium]
MKRLITAVLLTACCLITSTSLRAQGYTNAIGLRLGTSSGITFKHSLGNDAMLELMLTSRWHGWTFTGLYEKHAPAFQVDKLYWYYGAGAHAGFWNGNHHHPWYDDENHGDHFEIGVDGIIGLEYQITEIPFNVGIDWKPAFNIAEYTGLWADEFALSFRYTF